MNIKYNSTEKQMLRLKNEHNEKITVKCNAAQALPKPVNTVQ